VRELVCEHGPLLRLGERGLQDGVPEDDLPGRSEPKGEGIDGLTGHKVSGQTTESTPATTTSPAAPKVADPKVKTTEKSATGSSTSSVGEVPKVNPVLPVAKTLSREVALENLKP